MTTECTPIFPSNNKKLFNFSAFLGDNFTATLSSDFKFGRETDYIFHVSYENLRNLATNLHNCGFDKVILKPSISTNIDEFHLSS